MSAVEVIIIVAMEEEISPFLQRATSVAEPVRVGNAIHRTAVINGHVALLVQSGIGLVNAAGAATSALLLANRDEPDAGQPLVISAGSAGGLGDAVRVGDVVIGANLINADADARAFGYELGQVPGMPASYPVPQFLLDVSAVETVKDGLVDTVHQGLMVSSYSFVGHERSAVIKAAFEQVLSTDMESSAIAQTCRVHGAPFLAIRGISDLCGPASDADFLTHVDDAAERSAEITTAVVESWFAAGAPQTGI
ncbi:5'-methylthioadenosine/S-adenosylhomocysteine nucleosidase [Arthrobacter glacialis]|uniref:adenosylhomocysteine nucleosidase n=1 Tax=Arthrobacter glacialis TaxID=1664 RepID=A0A2S3ZTN8_ARTGL|nr:5'-methylthioadenosine/S-adenosylhomocysteine nucleosidase [Arthrobacter glacialis]POH72588.1 5'-methylthioadenosine/S-adenosylhomocysteine nucleosidase [Arthrobacter glacialis]